MEEKNAVWNTPYLFNGKELDKETGLSYYGARYYEPKTSVWISVDPLAEKFAGRSPYEYCFSNPINLIDPTGMGPDDWIGVNLGDGTYRPEWRENVTGKGDNDIGKGNIYIGKEKRINCLDGNVWQLNKDGSGYIVDAKGNKTSIGDNKKETKNSGSSKTELPPNNSQSSNKTAAKMDTPSTSGGISAGTTLALGAGSDYYTISASKSFFNIVNIGFTYTIDRFGNSYFSIAPGIGSKGVGGSIMANYIQNQQIRTEKDTQSFITGWGTTLSGGYYFGVQGMSSGPNPLTGSKSFGLGATTPGIGVSYGYTWKLD